MSIFKLDPAFKDYVRNSCVCCSRAAFSSFSPQRNSVCHQTACTPDGRGKKCDYDKVAESWELSCHKDGPSVVADGEYKGLTLNEYIEKAIEVMPK